MSVSGSSARRAMRITEVRTRRERNRFIDFPERLYPGDSNWVAPLRFERRLFLDPDANPFFAYADVRLFLAEEEDGTPRGRVAAIVNRKHLDIHNDGVGFFGLFESENDADVANALLDAAAAFLRTHGLKTMRGPANMSVNDDIGLLVEGFDAPPAVMMPYNPPYYRELLESWGLARVMRLFAYTFKAPNGPLPDRLTRGVALAKRRYRYTIRAATPRRLREEMHKVCEVYADAWQENWGAVPMTEREFQYMGKVCRWLGDLDLCLLAEVDGKPAGFSAALPDLNEALVKTRGLSLPFRVLHLLCQKRRIRSIRLLVMGVGKAYRNMGIDMCLCHETIVRGLAKGYRRMEASWILETNTAMNRVLEKFGARITKTYAMYERGL